MINWETVTVQAVGGGHDDDDEQWNLICLFKSMYWLEAAQIKSFEVYFFSTRSSIGVCYNTTTQSLFFSPVRVLLSISLDHHPVSSVRISSCVWGLGFVFHPDCPLCLSFSWRLMASVGVCLLAVPDLLKRWKAPKPTVTFLHQEQGGAFVFLD